MPSRRHASRSLRVTLVTTGLALGCLGGVAAGATTLVLSAGSATSSAGYAQTQTLRLTADRAVVSSLTPAPPAPAPARTAARRPHTTTQASRSQHRRRMPARAPRRPLRFGSHGSAVRWLQRHLGVAHTGHFARHTRAAVRTFQRRHHLHADGVVGRRTWSLLTHSRHQAARHHVTHRHRGPHVAAHHAARHHHFVLRRSRPLTTRQQINRVLRVARAQRGKPYVWGAAGPHAFDCSGYVQWVYRHAIGRKLPKYTDTQYRALEHIRARKLRRGDLIFVREGRHESHVGIYAGHHHWWVAPHTGSHVKLQRVWGYHNVYARVIH